MQAPADRAHGGEGSLDDEARRVLMRAERVADFSVNLNFYGPPVALIEAVRRAALDAYPDPRARAPREAWARLFDVPPECIAVGHGAADLFWALARALLRPGDRVLMAEPTFSEFRLAAEAAGAQLEAVWARPEHQFQVSLNELEERGRGARALYLCTPNNPTGVHVAADDVRRLARALPDTFLVLDQSFLALSEHAHETRCRFPDNVICVRSLTKEFALAGLRIGLLWATREVVNDVERMRPTWSTSAPAQAAIAAAAAQHAFVDESFARLRDDRERVRALLQAHGYATLPSTSIFQLVEVRDAAAFARALLAHGVLVRDCASFGLPAYARFAARPAQDLALLERALSRL